MSVFRDKLGANDLNCVDVPFNPTRSVIEFTHCMMLFLVTCTNVVLGVGHLSGLYVCVCVRVCVYVSTSKQTAGHVITKLIRWIVHAKSWSPILIEVKCQGRCEFALFWVPVPLILFFCNILVVASKLTLTAQVVHHKRWFVSLVGLSFGFWYRCVHSLTVFQHQSASYVSVVIFGHLIGRAKPIRIRRMLLKLNGPCDQSM